MNVPRHYRDTESILKGEHAKKIYNCEGTLESARGLTAGVIEILSHPATHMLVKAQYELLQASQPKVVKHILENIPQCLLIWTLAPPNSNGVRKRHYWPFTQVRNKIQFFFYHFSCFNLVIYIH